MSTFRFKQFSVCQDHAAMKVGTDSDLLGTLAEGGKRILDIGTGTGVLSLMMAQRFPEAQVTAVEIDDNAVIDARHNFSTSIFADRISLEHISFQEYIEDESLMGTFDSIVCNPPYFDKSLECDELGRRRARHSSSLPFEVLINGAYSLLADGGCFTVCIPPEVLDSFTSLSVFAGFCQKNIYKIKSVPEKEAKRFIIVYQKNGDGVAMTETFCMRNADRTYSDWYKEQLKDFLL